MSGCRLRLLLGLSVLRRHFLHCEGPWATTPGLKTRNFLRAGKQITGEGCEKYAGAVAQTTRMRVANSRKGEGASKGRRGVGIEVKSRKSRQIYIEYGQWELGGRCQRDGDEKYMRLRQQSSAGLW
jgi:hypothetical protein